MGACLGCFCVKEKGPKDLRGEREGEKLPKGSCRSYITKKEK